MCTIDTSAHTYVNILTHIHTYIHTYTNYINTIDEVLKRELNEDGISKHKGKVNYSCRFSMYVFLSFLLSKFYYDCNYNRKDSSNEYLSAHVLSKYLLRLFLHMKQECDCSNFKDMKTEPIGFITIYML